MKITYVGHSSFCVEFEKEKIVLIFDYYKGELPEFAKDSLIFMFASHKHYDHYSRKIFNLAYEYENITFILSKEMKMTEKYMDRWSIPEVSRDKIKYVTYDAEYDFADINVKTLKSTDAGVAYIVECSDRRIYHAGDLNWWIWNGNTEEENADMTRRFYQEIEKIKDVEFDVAFIPLDARQEDKFFWGFDYFMRNCSVKKAFPMHMWDKYDVIDELKKMEESKGYRDRIMKISALGQTFELE